MNLLNAIDVTNVAEPVARAGGRLLLILVAGIVALYILKRMIGRVDDHRVRGQLLFLVPKVTGVLVVIAGLAALGIDVSGMAAIMATVGFTGAVVFTPVGQNFVAGTMIRIDDLYQSGEVVTVGDLSGKVVHRSLLRTELELPDGSKAWVPNSTFQDHQVLNHSRMGGWRVTVEVPLDRSSDRGKAQRIMDEVVSTLEWNCWGKQAFVAFDRVGGEAMFFTAYAWITDRTQEPWYRGLLLNALVDALEAAGVSVGQTTQLALNPGRDVADVDRPG